MDTKTLLNIIEILLIPAGFWFLNRVVSKKDKLADERQQHICEKLDKLKEDILFQFDNHAHPIKCSNEGCGEPKTVGVSIIIPAKQG